VALGCRDPVERIEVLKANDPRRQRVGELFRAWWEHHGAMPIKASDLAEPVKAIADPQGRGRQHLASQLEKLAGTRMAGFVLARQAPAGKWGVATYAVNEIAADPIGHRGHREHREHRCYRPDGAAATPPRLPMTPMPDAIDCDDVPPGAEAEI
jgi:hypothetical protein